MAQGILDVLNQIGRGFERIYDENIGGLLGPSPAQAAPVVRVEDMSTDPAAQSFTGVPLPKPNPRSLLSEQAASPDPLQSIINRTLQEEGGFQNRKDDRGNFINGRLVGTKYGITPKAWAEHTGMPAKDITEDTIKGLTLDQAQEFYRSKAQKEFKLDRYPENLRPQIFDIMTNFGYTGGMKVLQRAAGVERDGRYGPKTAEAIKNLSNSKLAQARWDSYSKELKKKNPGWKTRTFSFAVD